MRPRRRTLRAKVSFDFPPFFVSFHTILSLLFATTTKKKKWSSSKCSSSRHLLFNLPRMKSCRSALWYRSTEI